MFVTDHLAQDRALRSIPFGIFRDLLEHLQFAYPKVMAARYAALLVVGEHRGLFACCHLAIILASRRIARKSRARAVTAKAFDAPVNL